MFFRHRENSVQLVRSTKNADGRQQNQVIGSLHLQSSKLSLADGIELENDEKIAFDEWLLSQKEIAKSENLIFAKKVDRNIQQLVTLMQTEAVELSEAEFEQISFAWRELRNTYNRLSNSK